MTRVNRKPIAAPALLALAFLTSPALAQTASFDRTVTISDHQQPAIPRPDQDAAAAAKLAEFEARTGKKPNILWIVIDDMGWGDPGGYGGGRPSAPPPPIWTVWRQRACG